MNQQIEQEETKSINGWNDLEAFGIDMLTGEACGIGFRLLCDLTKTGVEYIREFFSLANNDYVMGYVFDSFDSLIKGLENADSGKNNGSLNRAKNALRDLSNIKENSIFRNNWNGGTEDDPHVASIMLPNDIFEKLAVFCLIKSGYPLVLIPRTKKEEMEITDEKTGKKITVYVEKSRFGYHGGPIGCKDQEVFDQHVELYKSMDFTFNRYGKGNQPGTGLRNTHQMTGRTD